MFRYVFLFLLSFGFLPTSQSAIVVIDGPVNYVESIDGDLDTSVVGVNGTVFQLNQGITTISGSISAGAPSDLDTIWLVIPHGLSAQFDIDLTFEDIGAPRQFSSTWELSEALIATNCPVLCTLLATDVIAGEIFGTTTNGFAPGGDKLISDVDVLFEGSYVIDQTGGFIQPIITIPPEPVPDFPFITNYTITLDVTPVPIPGALLLFISSLMCLGFLRKNRC